MSTPTRTWLVVAAVLVVATLAVLLFVAFGLWASLDGPQFGSDGPQSGWTVTSPGDVDGDGTPDLLLKTRFEPAGNGRFGVTRVISGRSRECLWTLPNTPRLYDWVTKDAGDVNGDGREDLITLRDSTLVVTDVADRSELLALECEDYDLCVSVGDVNGDGCSDLLVQGHPHRPKPMGILRRPAWTYCVSLVSGKTGTCLWTIERREVERESSWRRGAEHGCVCGDIDDDGAPDVAINGDDDRVELLSGRDGSTVRTLDARCMDVGGMLVCAGDLDRDGADELLVRADLDDSIEVVSARSGRLLFTINASRHEPFMSAFAVGDWNEDGIVDLLATSCPPRIVSGADGSPLETLPELDYGDCAVDFDGDGRVDLCATSNIGGSEAERLGDGAWRAGRVEVLSGRDRSVLFAIQAKDLTPLER